jgi:hypothetical protein
LAQIVNQFMSEIQVPAVEKHRAALEAAFGIKSIAHKNLPNYDHNPATLVPSRLSKINLPTSPWRGRGAPSTVAEPEVHITAVPGVGSHNPTTPPRFATTTVPSFPMVEVPWGGLNAKLPTGNVAGALADVDSSSPAVPAKVVEPSLTTASPDSAYGDAEWFASSDVLSAVDKASAAMAQIRTHSPVALLTPSHTSSIGSSASTQLRRTPLPISKLSSNSDSDDERDTFIRQPAAALRLFAQPFPHMPAQKPALQPFTQPVPHTPARKPAFDAFPSVISISSRSSISSISTSTLASSVAVPAADPPQQVIPAYAGFNPIIPPGPITEKWLMVNGWAPQWGNVVRKVAEECTLARWVPVLMECYEIDAASAEALKHCIMKDFALVGSVSG